jgi:PIN domain nuclease of toxin-antitoxin system
MREIDLASHIFRAIGAAFATALPLPHCDPFDRLRAAQTILDGDTMLSADHAFDRLGVPRIW